MAATVIGYYKLDTSKIFQNTFECAAWREDVEVQPGEYPMELIDMKVKSSENPKYNNELESFIDGAYISMHGTIVSDYFAGQYCGVPISDYDTTQNKGKPASHRMMVYMYEVARSILQDENSPYHLNPEYEAREIHFEYNGEPCCTWGIFKKQVH